MRTAIIDSRRPISRSAVLLGSIIAVLTFAGAGVLWWRSDRSSRIDPDDTAQVALGRSVYTAQCARCHGANLEGQPNWRRRQANDRLPAPPHDETGHSWHHPDEVLLGITKLGVGPYAPAGYESDMPAFAEILSDEEIAATLAYIKSRWPPEIRERQARINQQGTPQ